MRKDDIFFPAIFHKDEDGGYSVEFPDIPEFSDGIGGDSVEDAFMCATIALGNMFEYAETMDEIPPRSTYDNVYAERCDEDDFVLLVPVDNLDTTEGMVDSNAAEYMKEGMEKKGYTPAEVAEILDIEEDFLSDYIGGHVIPSYSLAKRIATLLDFDYERFFDIADADIIKDDDENDDK
ncbi:MAG: type II toxin-antitoxin system HicB family antitoxin [Clostridia bacterium]|nr:type II toxin-antitoxin system HicB family antitoxin [Clostridia bacterium]